MDTITNSTNELFRLTYWKAITSGLNQNITIDINPDKTIQIPNDYCVDEFIVLSENYANRIFKFCIETTYVTNSKIISYSDDIIASISDNILHIK